MENKEQEKLMTGQEVSQYLGVHEMTFYRWCRAKLLPALKIGGRWRVKRSELEDFLKSKVVTNGQ